MNKEIVYIIIKGIRPEAGERRETQGLLLSKGNCPSCTRETKTGPVRTAEKDRALNDEGNLPPAFGSVPLLPSLCEIQQLKRSGATERWGTSDRIVRLSMQGTRRYLRVNVHRRWSS